MDDNPQRPMTEQEAMAQHEADMASMPSWHEASDGVYVADVQEQTGVIQDLTTMAELDELAETAVPTPRPEYITVDYSQFRNGFNMVQDSALEEYLLSRRHGRSRVKTVEPEEPKEVNLMPRKMSKAKEWSISARALKRVIESAITERARYDYKFQCVYDERFRIYRIWNGVTQNVVATVKNTQNGAVIRYRENSHYACAIADMNGKEVPAGYRRNGKIMAVPSSNLRIHRGRAEYGTNQTSKSKDAQLGFRRSAYELALRNRDKEQAKKMRREGILF